MKITFKELKTVDVTHLLVDAGVRYWEDAKINDVEDESGEIVPFKVGDRWQPTIKLDDGIIINWPKGVAANIHFKICDDGKYHLMNQAGEVVRSIEGYVPAVLCPSRNGYGDYIIMDIDGDGKIQGWKLPLDLEDFTADDED